MLIKQITGREMHQIIQVLSLLQYKWLNDNGKINNFGPIENQLNKWESVSLSVYTSDIQVTVLSPIGPSFWARNFKVFTNRSLHSAVFKPNLKYLRFIKSVVNACIGQSKSDVQNLTDFYSHLCWLILSISYLLLSYAPIQLGHGSWFLVWQVLPQILPQKRVLYR